MKYEFGNILTKSQYAFENSTENFDILKIFLFCFSRTSQYSIILNYLKLDFSFSIQTLNFNAV